MLIVNADEDGVSSKEEDTGQMEKIGKGKIPKISSDESARRIVEDVKQYM